MRVRTTNAGAMSSKRISHVPRPRCTAAYVAKRRSDAESIGASAPWAKRMVSAALSVPSNRNIVIISTYHSTTAVPARTTKRG
jgi:hypothetical protein